MIAFWFLLVEGVFLWLILRFKKRDGVPAQYITGELKSEKNWVHYPHLPGAGLRRRDPRPSRSASGTT